MQFNTTFSNAVATIRKGDAGVVVSGKGALGFLGVEAKGQLWLCRPYEIRPEGTEIADADRQAMHDDFELVSDFLKWEQGMGE